MFRDIRRALRMLLRDRLFALVAVITLAIGIGTNTLIFSLISGILWKPLPYKDSSHILLLQENNKSKGVDHFAVAPANYGDWRTQNNTLESMGAFRIVSVNLTGVDDPEKLEAVQVSADVFPALGAQPRLGRVFVRQEDQPGQDKVAVLSDSLWRRLGARQDILGSTLLFNNEPRTIVGVMPKGFYFPIETAEVWLPMAMAPAESANRATHSVFVVARPKPGVSTDSVRNDLNVIAQRLQTAYPKTNAGSGVTVISLLDSTVGSIRPGLRILSWTVFLILAIACVNVTNLLLARNTVRRREFAVRTALGAKRIHLVRALATENLLLALAGGLLGLGVAYGGLTYLKRLGPPEIPRLQDATLDGTVLAITLLIALATGLFLTIGPLFSAENVVLQEALGSSGRTTTTGRASERSQRFLVAMEVGLALVVLIGAGLLVKTLLQLQSADLGFQPDKVLTLRLDLPPARYSGRQIEFFRELTEKVRTLPGVTAAGLIDGVPLSGYNPLDKFQIEGQSFPPGNEPGAIAPVVGPGYFEAAGIPLLKGRFFLPSDTSDSQPVLVISSAMAKKFWPNEDPVGKRIKPLEPDFPWCTIAGVVGDIRQRSVESAPAPTFYYLYTQIPKSMQNEMLGRMTLVVRSPEESSTLGPSLKNLVRQADRELPVYDMMPMDEVLTASLSKPRFNSLLLGTLAIEALLLAIVGVYGLTSYVMDQRRRDIAIRMAFGAQRSDIMFLMLSRSSRAVVAGLVAGILGALLLTRFLTSLLYGVKALDLNTFIFVSLVMAAAAFIASLIPALRATVVDPALTIRE